MPSYSEMMKLFGFKSKNAVFRLVEKFIEVGFVTKDHLGRILPSRSFNDISMLGYVTAGFPATVEEEMRDTVNLDDFLVAKKENRFLLEVDGDSMIDAHIATGDMVLVEKANKARDGQIVIAQIDGEFTMKYFRKQESKKGEEGSEKIWLEPANKKYSPLYPQYELKIVAVIKAVIRKY